VASSKLTVAQLVSLAFVVGSFSAGCDGGSDSGSPSVSGENPVAAIAIPTPLADEATAPPGTMGKRVAEFIAAAPMKEPDDRGDGVIMVDDTGAAEEGLVPVAGDTTAEAAAPPAEGAAPADTGTPADGAAAPEEGATPAEAGTPADGAAGEAKPVEGEAKPAEGADGGEAKPAEGEAKPAEGAAEGSTSEKPAEGAGEAKPAEDSGDKTPATDTTKPKPKPAEKPKPAPPKANGQDVFNKKCKGCHGPDGSKAKDASFKEPGWKKEWSQSKIERIVKGGKPGTKMKAFAGALSEDEIRAVAIFSRSLGS